MLKLLEPKIPFFSDDEEGRMLFLGRMLFSDNFVDEKSGRILLVGGNLPFFSDTFERDFLIDVRTFFTLELDG